MYTAKRLGINTDMSLVTESPRQVAANEVTEKHRNLMPWASQLMKCKAARHQDGVDTGSSLVTEGDPHLLVSMLETPSLNSFARFVSAIVPWTILVLHGGTLRSQVWHKPSLSSSPLASASQCDKQICAMSCCKAFESHR